MAKAKTTTPSANKPIHRIRSGNVLLTVWEGPRATVQREYRFDGKIGYADSLRVEDMLDLKRALDQFVIWAEAPKGEFVVPHTEDVSAKAK